MASSPRRYKLAAFTKNRTNPAYIGARLGADRVAARLGCSLRHHVPTKPDDVEEQRGLLAAVLAEGVDAILLAPSMPPRSTISCSAPGRRAFPSCAW